MAVWRNYFTYSSGFQVLADARFLRDDKWHPKAQVDGKGEEVNNGTA